LQVASLSDVATTPTYRSSIGTFVVPGSPTKSPLFQRIADSARFRRRMPPIATKLVDRVGLAMLERWIIELGKGRLGARQSPR
ncbi:MAG TPA: hypothetical protein VHZ95_08585, partial [Polyangiales bacterium]|nr:hypothetical protein [Polyangiales bacterium]